MTGGGTGSAPRMRRALALGLALALGAAPPPARANGDPASGPPTVFERFVLSACVPCVRESYALATLKVEPPPLPPFPRGTAAATARPGEIGLEVLRAHQPGRAGWSSLALRVTLSVASGPAGDLFRLATGLLDGADVAALAQAVAAMSTAAPPAGAGQPPDSVDADFHAGSVRVGVLRLGTEAVAYVQAGDLPTLLARAVWEVPTTLYVPLTDVPALAAALGRAAATVEQLRAR